MSAIPETLFDLLLNAVLQIGFFAILAAVFSRLVRKASAKHQHIFYLAVLLFCLATPVINTFWRFAPTVAAEKSERQVASDGGASNRFFWSWGGPSKQHKQITIAPQFQTWIVG